MAGRNLSDGRPPLRGAPALVIGYGNPLRGDDAVGPEVAAAVAEWGMPDVQGLAVQQLTPELAEPVARARLVVFVDAYPVAAGGPVHVRRLESGSGWEALGHTADPRSLLGLARALYGGCPPAWLVTVPGADFDFGAGLSPTTRGRMPTALRRIARLVQEGAATDEVNVMEDVLGIARRHPQ